MSKITNELVNTAEVDYGYCTRFETGEKLHSKTKAWEVLVEKYDNRGPYDDATYFLTEEEADKFISNL